MAISIGIAKKDREQVAQQLSQLLADTYSLYLKTHSFHWNITGPQFNSLHTMFETQYNELWLAADEVAERIRTLDVFAPGSYSQFGKLTSIADLKPHETVVIMVTKDDLLVNGRSVGKVADVASMPNDKMIIPLLAEALKAQADVVLRQTSEDAVKDREVTIMGDKGTPFSVLKRVMATATSADYGKVSLAVIQREREVGGA